ncbi:MAG: GNAT family N-acetyltransferase, partial [Oscillospiraceae bacterium]|nr:GNAT family N-acetyltransferase [Oscillospiraceae bacterium]
MELETDRLILRPHTPDDFEDYFEYIMDPDLQQMLGLNGVEDRESAQATFQWLLDNVEFIAVVRKESGKVIGHACIHPPDDKVAGDLKFTGKKGASITFAIAKQEQRKGLMLEALQCLMAQMFREGVDYIDCEYTPL